MTATSPSPETSDASRQWQARPFLGNALRLVLLAVPLLASMATVFGLARLLPDGAARSWWGLVLLLSAAVAVAMVLERGARRLLPIALILQLSMIFPDQAPSRLRLARATALRPPRNELLWHGAQVRPTSTSELVLDLVAALGTHDRRTRGHSERVRLLCDMLAAELKLDDDARDRLRWAALLHDVGKLDVSPTILNKPAQLTTTEFDRIKEHPAAGALLVTPLLPWLGEWGDGILDHHERYDGGGYPNGKAGESISLSGRLIGLVDAFETMTAARPYKKAMAHKAAREELARCAGAHFDPVLVRAFLAISLPRVLWAMGPVSFLLQLPFVQPIAQVGAAGGAAVPQAAAALAVGAAGAAALATGGASTAPDSDVQTLGSRPTIRLEQLEDDLARRADPAAPTAPAAAAPAAPAPEPAPRPAAAGPTTPVAPAPAPAATRAPAPAPEPEPMPAPQDASSDRAILDGPPPVTSSREATFELAERPGVEWQCQLQRNAAGQGSRWELCSGTFTVTVVRDGAHVMRVRNAETREQVDEWEWTVESAQVPAADTHRQPGARATS